MLLKLRARRGLRTRIIAWSFVPTTIILLAVALATFYAYQRVAEDLVLGRNQELTRLSAGQLASDMAEHSALLASLAGTNDLRSTDRQVQQLALRRAANRLVIFDAGVVVLTSYGTVAAAEPERPELLGQDWSTRGHFRQMLRSVGPVFSDVVADGPGGTRAIVVAVPITGSQNEFRGVLAGMFALGASSVSAFYGGIAKLRIGERGTTYLVDSTGRVIYHSDPDRVGEDFSGREVLRRLQGRRATDPASEPLQLEGTVASLAAVPGTSWSLLTEESWDALMRPSQGYRQLLLLLLGLGVVVPSLVVTVGVRRITGPIAQLIAAAQEVAAGSFGQTITARTGDELEDLAEQFNLMSAQLKESYSDLERKVADRTRELATLNAIAAVVSRSLELDEILNDALEKTLQAVGIDAGGIFLLEEAEGRLCLAAHRGLPAEVASRIAGLEVGEGFSGRVVQRGEPVAIRDVTSEPWLSGIAPLEYGPVALVGVPLTSRGKVLGALFGAARAPREFSGQEVQLLCSIGSQIGVAVQNARLFESAQQLAVMEERNRLARDLHDSVTQAMYGATLYAEAAARLLAAGRPEAAIGHLQELRSTAQQALREMRSLIFELRPPVLEKEGLVAALQTRLEAVEERAGLETELKVEGDGPLPIAVQEGLYRIAQEALNNILKHSGAHTVRVYLRQDPLHPALEVVDDGAGFDPSSAREHAGLGLRGMHERAARLGGTIEVRSAPGEGTRVLVEVGSQDERV